MFVDLLCFNMSFSFNNYIDYNSAISTKTKFNSGIY